MFTLFALTRMAVRAGVLAALVATVLSVSAELAADGDWEAIGTQVEGVLEWLHGLWRRVADVDSSIGEIRLAQLGSPRGWIDLGTGLFGGGDRPIEIDQGASALVAADG